MAEINDIPDTAEEVHIVTRLHSNGHATFRCPHCNGGLAVMLTTHAAILDEDIDPLPVDDA